MAAAMRRSITPAPKAAVCIYIGKLGAGAGIVLDGKVWGGAAGFAGELHYLPIEHNLEYAQNHFAGADMSDYFTKVICGCAALINPDRVVLYADPRLADKASQICVSCAQALPEQAMPVIEAVSVLRAGLHPRVIYLGEKDGGNHMKYFVFDIDGTLIDSSKVDQWAMRTALAEFGYHFTYEQLIFSFGMPADEHWRN